MLRTFVPGVQPAAEPTLVQDLSFEANVRQGNICAAPLAMVHDFSVFTTSADKTQFTEIDAVHAIGEIRSFTWAADGKELFLLGNTLGSGNLYRADPISGQAIPVLAAGELRYMMDAAWSQDGKKVALWSGQNNQILYVMNADGTELKEMDLENAQILGAPQFWPDGSSVVFYGATPTAWGLFEIMLINGHVAQIYSYVESAGSFAFSPDGSKIAFVEYGRENGEARLTLQDLATRDMKIHGAFSIPKGSGSSAPQVANLSWSPDGKWLTFDAGRGAGDRTIYLASTDQPDLFQAIGNGRAPAISSDGQCLAFIKDRQVLLLDLTQLAATPLSIGKLPVGRGPSYYQFDRLQWQP
jgi:Tol biopolymer transport system component